MSTYEKQKEGHAKFATMAWLASGLYLFYAHKGAHFLSWQAAAYFIVGTFIAAVVFGWLSYALQRGMAKAMMVVVKRPSSKAAAVVGFVGIILVALDATIVFLGAKEVVQLLH